MIVDGMNFGYFAHHPGVVAADFYILQITRPQLLFSPAAGLESVQSDRKRN